MALSEEQRADLATRGGAAFVVGGYAKDFNRSLWDVLNVAPEATNKEIIAAKKARVREAMKEQGDLAAASRIGTVRKASALLLDPGRRRVYELLGGDVGAANACLDADEVWPNVWLGGKDFLTVRGLKAIGATHVLTVAKGLQVILDASIRHRTLAVDDKPEENLLEGPTLVVDNKVKTNLLNGPIDEGVRFMSDAISQGGCVFVHCMAGISRSASVVLAYLMQQERLSLRAAYEVVKLKRSLVDPNSGFMRQLIAFERALTDPKACRKLLLEIVLCEPEENIEEAVGGDWRVWGADKSLADRAQKGMV